MKIDIITIFPEFFDSFINTSIIKRAIDREYVSINIHNLRDYSNNKHKQIDDTPYGGGAGMLMMFPPFYEILKKIKTDTTKVILLSPQGKLFNQEKANYLVNETRHLILLCGHYEGIDARIEQFIDYEISIGNYVLTGGEMPAMIIADAVTRLIPGVILEESHQTDSLENNRLKYPQFTKPESYEGYSVPDILLSGHHGKIALYRKQQAIIQTKNKRPDLIEKQPLSLEEKEILEKQIK